jgi:hypothetical protein
MPIRPILHFLAHPAILNRDQSRLILRREVARSSVTPPQWPGGAAPEGLGGVRCLARRQRNFGRRALRVRVRNQRCVLERAGDPPPHHVRRLEIVGAERADDGFHRATGKSVTNHQAIDVARDGFQAEDGVRCEPVSTSKFPEIREKYREIRENHALAPHFEAQSSRNSKPYRQIPCVTNREVAEKYRQILSYEQGTPGQAVTSGARCAVRCLLLPLRSRHPGPLRGAGRSHAALQHCQGGST